MPGIQPVKGRRLRATKIDGCGRPIAGPRNRLVTGGYVSLTLTPVMRDATDLTQDNAEGKECFSDRTAPERRWYTPVLELCNVNTGLLAMFTGWETLLDLAAVPIGFRDDKVIESDYGIALELWTAGKMDDDCAVIPTTDAALSAPGSGKSYGYFLFGGTEWVPGDIQIGATVSTFSLTGRTIALPSWGLGPYNVVQDLSGNPRRLITPTSKKEHLTAFRTLIAPPDPTPGSEPVPLATSTVFTGTNYYYGGPSGQPAIAVAPGQGDSTTTTVVVAGATGGTFILRHNGNPTTALAFNAPTATVLAALAAIDDGIPASAWNVAGTPGNYTITKPPGVLTADPALLTPAPPTSSVTVTGGA